MYKEHEKFSNLSVIFFDFEKSVSPKKTIQTFVYPNEILSVKTFGLTLFKNSVFTTCIENKI